MLNQILRIIKMKINEIQVHVGRGFIYNVTSQFKKKKKYQATFKLHNIYL